MRLIGRHNRSPGGKRARYRGLSSTIGGCVYLGPGKGLCNPLNELLVELRHLRYFIRAAELLHFTRAAESLYISQPTLSVCIQQLEEEIGAPLFARIGRHVQLTEAGQLLLNRARQAVNELQTASDEIQAATELKSGRLKISALPLFSTTVLPVWITRFNALYPLVHIKARSASSEDIEAGLLSGVYNLGFSIAPTEHTDMQIRQLFNDEVVLVVSKKHPLAKLKRIELSDLNELPVAMHSYRVASARLVHKYLHDHGVQFKCVVEYDDGNALLKIAGEGNLATLLPRMGVHDADLRTFSLPDGGIEIAAVAMYTHLNPAAKAFLAIAQEITASAAITKS